MAQSTLVAVGTYTRTTSDGIYICEFDGETGDLDPVSSMAGAENPSFLAQHPNGQTLYAASETEEFDGKRQGALYAYSIDADTGRLSPINAVGSGGAGPCHVSVDATGRYLLAANYHGGSVCVAPINDDGSLEPLSCFIQHEGSSVNPDRQEQAHAHSINLDAQNRFAYVPDLGQDKVVVYRLDLERGELVANDPAHVDSEPGAGPRHFDFHPNGARAYVINELGCTITGYDYDSDSGALTPFQTVGHTTCETGIREAQHDGGHPRPPVGQVRVRLQPGPRQHRYLLGGRADWTANVRGPRVDSGLDASQLRDRPVRRVPARGQPGLRHDRNVQNRW